MSELKTIKLPGDAEPRVIVDGAAVHFDKPQGLSPEKQSQARANIGASSDYYSTEREELSVTLGVEGAIPHRDAISKNIWALYDELVAKYPDRIKRNDIVIDAVYDNEGNQLYDEDGNPVTFTNYEYVISTGEYNPATGYYYDKTLPRRIDTDVNKPKYLILTGVDGFEKPPIIAAYRFIRDVIEGHNVPKQFIDGCVISIMPVGNPYSMDTLYDEDGNRYSVDEVYDEHGNVIDENAVYRLFKANENRVKIGRNFDSQWESYEEDIAILGKMTNGLHAESEAETKAIKQWLEANADAEIFFDCHIQGVKVAEVIQFISQKVGSNPNYNPCPYRTQKKIAMRGVNRVIRFWRDTIGYPENTVFATTNTLDIPGTAFRYASEGLGIPALCFEFSAQVASTQEEFREDIWAITPETVAATAEVIGNVLIEFYEQYAMGEVMDMTETNEKLDGLAEGVTETGGKVDDLSANMRDGMAAIQAKLDLLLDGTEEPAEPTNGFRIERGVYTAETDSSSAVPIEIPCSPGAKIFAFVPDDTTREKLEKMETVPTFLSYIGQRVAKLPSDLGENAVEPMYRGHNSFIRRKCMEAGCAGYDELVVYDGYESTSDNTNGFKFTAIGLKIGTYNWTAYYWDEPEEA